MVRNVANRFAAQKAWVDQSSSDNNSPVNQLLPPSLSFSLEQYYSDTDSEPQIVRSIPWPPNSAQKKIAYADKMFWVTNALTQAAQIKLQLNKPDDWVKWNWKLNGTLAIANLWKVLIGDKVPLVDIDDDSYVISEDNQESLNGVLLVICGPSALSVIEKKKTHLSQKSTSYWKLSMMAKP